MKKQTARLLALALAVAIMLSGCAPKSQPSDFDAFIAGLPKEMVSGSSMDVNFVFQNPADFGIEESLQRLPFTSKEDAEEGVKETEALLQRLQKFDYQSLSEEQRLTYDVLKDALERSLAVSKFYYLDAGYLGSLTGFQAQLPLLLDEYNLNRKSDVESYLNLLETSEETFRSYAQLERERQENGAGLSQAIIDKIITQCETFAAKEDSFLVESFYRRLDAADFLTDQERAAYKERGEAATNQNLRQAYSALAEELRTIQGSDETLGLAHREDGGAYYEALIRYNVGVDDTPEELYNYLNQKYNQTLLAMQMMAAQDGDETLIDRAEAHSEPQVALDSVEEVLEYLYHATDEHFPPLEQLQYKISYVDESMKDNFSPAAYLTSRVDTPISSQETIIINGDFDPNLFPTIAHEGYPGHMYQTVFYKSLNPPVVRRLLNYTGYTEGWAVYVEDFVSRYADGDQEALEFVGYFNTLQHVYTAMMDLGVHYQGWTLDEFIDFISQLYGPIPRDAAEEMYQLIAELPTYYLYYYVGGMRFQDLHAKAEDALGEKFDFTEFHRTLLSAGPCSFAILEQQVDKYIAANS